MRPLARLAADWRARRPQALHGAQGGRRSGRLRLRARCAACEPPRAPPGSGRANSVSRTNAELLCALPPGEPSAGGGRLPLSRGELWSPALPFAPGRLAAGAIEAAVSRAAEGRSEE